MTYAIAKQIKQSGRAYPLFGTGRLFLERPERHRVRITSDNPEVPLHQLGDGPVSFDRAALERAAFFAERSKYYKEEVVEGEPIKGNFSNVAKLRGGGPIIGPTNSRASVIARASRGVSRGAARNVSPYSSLSTRTTSP